MPDEIDLSEYRSKEPTQNEELLPDESAETEIQVDQGALEQLLSMGFPEVRCRKGLLITGNNGADVAMNWLFEHMDDPGTFLQ
jgi:ubiquitin carboxyl-terminal hydrolase 5/13